jgi:ADP-heptose:LPS heptosyltransferase
MTRQLLTVGMIGKSDLIRPSGDVCMSSKKVFRMYGEQGARPGAGALLIHARKVHKRDKWNREWPIHNFVEIASRFSMGSSCDIVSIGSKNGAERVPGTFDGRDMPLPELCSLMRVAKCVLSPSSGPAHLASLCGCPHVVMTDNEYKKAIKGTNKDRYERLWNPFLTPCKVLDKHNWQPPVDVVWGALCRFLK